MEGFSLVGYRETSDNAAWHSEQDEVKFLEEEMDGKFVFVENSCIFEFLRKKSVADLMMVLPLPTHGVEVPHRRPHVYYHVGERLHPF